MELGPANKNGAAKDAGQDGGQTISISLHHADVIGCIQHHFLLRIQSEEVLWISIILLVKKKIRDHNRKL